MLEIIFIVSAFSFYMIPALILYSQLNNPKTKKVKKIIKDLMFLFIFWWIGFFVLHIIDETSNLNYLLEQF
jgi:hypothetical protein